MPGSVQGHPCTSVAEVPTGHEGARLGRGAPQAGRKSLWAWNTPRLTKCRESVPQWETGRWSDASLTDAQRKSVITRNPDWGFPRGPIANNHQFNTAPRGGNLNFSLPFEVRATPLCAYLHGHPAISCQALWAPPANPSPPAQITQRYLRQPPWTSKPLSVCIQSGL